MSAKSFRQIVGVPPSTASTKDSVLIIIDAQNEYANGHLTVKNVAESRKAIKTLLDKYRAAGGHVVHVVHDTPQGAPVFTPGTELAEEFAELKPQDNEVTVRKNYPGAFASTNLEEVIGKTGLKKLVITGYMAHICVSTTTRQAAQRGYDVIVVEDAIGDRDIPGVQGEELTKVVLAELADGFATVVKQAEIK